MLLFMHRHVSSLKRNPGQPGENCCRGSNCSNSANDKLVLNLPAFTTLRPKADHLSGYVTSGEVALHLQISEQNPATQITTTTTQNQISYITLIAQSAVSKVCFNNVGTSMPTSSPLHLGFEIKVLLSLNKHPATVWWQFKQIHSMPVQYRHG